MPIRSGGVKGKIVDGGKPTWHAHAAVPPSTGLALSAPATGLALSALAGTVEGPALTLSSSASRLVIHLSLSGPSGETVITAGILSRFPLQGCP
jgi:hypothetical protein